ncbi:MAG: SGNH/GDSL hydrolase family protein [Clostridia bacterium]|nr:SGNH/GDSL hydrolase family protein [Clostridia bacterium]
MKILFYGDSITDAGRNRETDTANASYGFGYVRSIAGKLLFEDPTKYQILNRGISGDRIVDLYARIKKDLWNEEPDVLSILIGVNDVWHEISRKDGVELSRFERVYRMLLEDTKERLPSTKIILCEPYVMKGLATEEEYDEFLVVKEYAKVVKKLAKEYGLYFLPLQEKLDEYATKFDVKYFLADGVHPMIASAQLIADEWLNLFKKEIDK